MFVCCIQSAGINSEIELQSLMIGMGCCLKDGYVFCFKTHSLDRCPLYLPSGRVKSAVVPCSREEQRCEVDGTSMYVFIIND